MDTVGAIPADAIVDKKTTTASNKNLIMIWIFNLVTNKV